MKQNFTHIAALLDRSGSMAVVQADTIGGFNTFLEEQKKVPGEATITLAQFSDKYEVTYMDVPLEHVAKLTPETYRPSGWTSLNDALARLINELGTKLASKPEHERPSKVIVLIMTDGQENTSKEFAGFEGLRKLNQMVTHQRDKYSWEFVFMGANIDSFATAQNYGFAKTATINYCSDSIGTYNAFKSASRGVVATRFAAASGGTLDAFFENERNRDVVSNTTLDTMDIGATIAKYSNANTTTTQETQTVVTPDPVAVPPAPVDPTDSGTK